MKQNFMMKPFKLFPVILFLIAATFLPGCKAVKEIHPVAANDMFTIDFVCRPGTFDTGEFYRQLPRNIRCTITMMPGAAGGSEMLEKVEVNVWTTAAEWPAVKGRLMESIGAVIK